MSMLLFLHLKGSSPAQGQLQILLSYLATRDHITTQILIGLVQLWSKLLPSCGSMVTMLLF